MSTGQKPMSKISLFLNYSQQVGRRYCCICND